MKIEDRSTLLSKLVYDKELLSLLRVKKRTYDIASVSKTDKAVQQEYIDDGWEEFGRPLKTRVKFRKDKRQDIAFEDKLWTLLGQMGFSYLNRDRFFAIPYDKKNSKLTQQIDVFAKDDDSILIAECKSTSKNQRSDFKIDFEAWSGKIDGIINTVKELFPDKTYKIKFLFATENYELSPQDRSRLQNINGVHLPEDTIDYYLDMFGQIGSASKYQFLGNIFSGLEIPGMENQVPAIQGKMGGHTYYSFSIEPEKLLKISFVLHRSKANENMMPTYQRIIKRARLKKINSFLDDKKGYFPNSIVISLDSGKKKRLRFERSENQIKTTISNLGILHLPKKYQSAFIIDGQHRLYGYADSQYKSTNTIPVVAFLNLERKEQVKLFMQINENQKAVSKNLRLTLDADLLWTSSIIEDQLKALRSRTAIHLGESRGSSLYDLVSIGEDKKIITSRAITSGLKSSSLLGEYNKNGLTKIGVFFNGEMDYSYDRLSSFTIKVFNIVEEAAGAAWSMENSLFLTNKAIYSFIVLSGNLVEHFVNTKAIRANSDIDFIIAKIEPILTHAAVCLDKLDEKTGDSLRTTYGTGGDTKFWRHLQFSVSEVYEDIKFDGLEEYRKREEKEYNNLAFNLVRDIEKHFKRDFQLRLEDEFGELWFEKGVPEKIGEKVTVDAYKKNRLKDVEDDEVSPWDCLTIIAYRQIAESNWTTIFEAYYTKPGEEKIRGGKSAKTSWMQKVERIRNQIVHSYYVTEEEYTFLKEIHDWLITEK